MVTFFKTWWTTTMYITTKKLINDLLDASRQLWMGPQFFHSNRLLMRCERFGNVEVDLRWHNLERKNRQNLQSALKLFHQVHNCLLHMVQGIEAYPPYAEVSLLAIWHYVEIFISGRASLLECVLVWWHISWRNRIIVTQNFTLAAKVLSCETYTDVVWPLLLNWFNLNPSMDK